MDSPLFIQKAYLNGTFISSENTFEVINPATLQAVGTVPNLDVATCRLAIEQAQQAWQTWKSASISERCRIVRKLYELTLQHKRELAEIMTLESGKPLAESLAEVIYGASFIEWFAEEGKRSYGETIPSLNGKNNLSTIKQSVGVVAAITPWNFPLAMLTRKVAPALVTGCPVVLKPASQTPFTAIAFAKLAEEAGVPNGVFNVITSKDSKGIGKELATNELVRKISFTGSTAVGRTLMEQSASTIKRISLELGGNAPFIVFGDADLDQAVEGAIAAKFRNTGQTCISVNRFYVHDSIYQEFSEKLTIAIQKLKIGNGMDEGVNIGPLINRNAVEKVQDHVQNAIKLGAKVAIGGELIKDNFYSPTVLLDIHPDSTIAHEETFGPVCALFRFADEQEAITYANDTPFGLAAYFYSENVRRCIRVAEQLESGMIGINTGVLSNVSAPFGGVKQSGIGREGSKYGLDEYLEIKYLCYGK